MYAKELAFILALLNDTSLPIKTVGDKVQCNVERSSIRQQDNTSNKQAILTRTRELFTRITDGKERRRQRRKYKRYVK